MLYHKLILGRRNDTNKEIFLFPFLYFNLSNTSNIFVSESISTLLKYRLHFLVDVTCVSYITIIPTVWSPFFMELSANILNFLLWRYTRVVRKKSRTNWFTEQSGVFYRMTYILLSISFKMYSEFYYAWIRFTERRFI